MKQQACPAETQQLCEFGWPSYAHCILSQPRSMQQAPSSTYISHVMMLSIPPMRFDGGAPWFTQVCACSRRWVGALGVVSVQQPPVRPSPPPARAQLPLLGHAAGGGQWRG
jgi:hypothetical protein